MSREGKMRIKFRSWAQFDWKHPGGGLRRAGTVLCCCCCCCCCCCSDCPPIAHKPKNRKSTPALIIFSSSSLRGSKRKNTNFGSSGECKNGTRVCAQIYGPGALTLLQSATSRKDIRVSLRIRKDGVVLFMVTEPTTRLVVVTGGGSTPCGMHRENSLGYEEIPQAMCMEQPRTHRVGLLCPLL